MKSICACLYWMLPPPAPPTPPPPPPWPPPPLPSMTITPASGLPRTMTLVHAGVSPNKAASTPIRFIRSLPQSVGDGVGQLVQHIGRADCVTQINVARHRALHVGAIDQRRVV